MINNMPTPARTVGEALANAIARWADEYYVVINNDFRPANEEHMTLHEFLNIFDEEESFYCLVEDIIGAEWADFELTDDQKGYGDEYVNADDVNWREAVWNAAIVHPELTRTLEWFAKNAAKMRRDIEAQENRLSRLLAFHD